MSNRARQRLVLAGTAGVALGVAGFAVQRQFKRRIANDPEGAALDLPLEGRQTTVRSADGTALHVEAFGDEDAPTLVLLHGWTENLSFWTYQIHELTERGLRIVAYDLRGHGQSEAAAGGDYSIARFGEDLEAVLEACVVGGRRAMVVGHSLGGMAIEAWAEHHDVERRVGAAALINTGAGDLIAEQLLVPVPAVAQALNHTIAVNGFLGSKAPLPHFSTPLVAAAIRYVAFGPDASPAQVAYYERMLIASPPDARAQTGIALSEVELYDALPNLTVPTIVIAGENDRLTPPSHARRTAEMLPQLEGLTVLPRTGHMGPLERHREVTELLAQLAATIGHDAGAVAA
jgi:pimeloyl-ACP methyl ester carboxylesterase